MNIRTRAALEVVFLIAATIAFSAAFSWILNYLTSQQLIQAAGIMVMSWMIYLLWSIRVSQLESRDTLRRMNDLSKPVGPVANTKDLA